MRDRVIKIVSYVMVAVLSAGSAVLWCFAGTQMFKNNEVAQKQDVIDQLTANSKIDELQAKIYEYFIGEYDQGKMDDAAAAAIVQALGDPWSYYMTAEQYGGYQDTMNNVTIGIGITIQAKDDGSGYEILSVTKNSPAYEKGVLKKDVITAVNGVSVVGMDMATITNMVKGEEGTVVELTVARGGESLTFQVERKTFQLPVAQYRMLEGKIGLVTIENFDARCADETKAAVEALRQQGAVALIFDVRNNPGGYKSELVSVLDYLLPEGVIFKSENYMGETQEDRSDKNCVDLPMAVLVNGNSYSAAEFFAAALDDYDAAIVVGEKTCGKGYFQNTFVLSDGSAVNLSTGKYYTPNGTSLAGVGLTPELEVPVDEWTAYYIALDALEPEEDPQIMAAVNALKSAN